MQGYSRLGDDSIPDRYLQLGTPRKSHELGYHDILSQGIFLHNLTLLGSKKNLDINSNKYRRQNAYYQRRAQKKENVYEISLDMKPV